VEPLSRPNSALRHIKSFTLGMTPLSACIWLSLAVLIPTPDSPMARRADGPKDQPFTASVTLSPAWREAPMGPVGQACADIRHPEGTEGSPLAQVSPYVLGKVAVAFWLSDRATT
jgi:hypothetical protein